MKPQGELHRRLYPRETVRDLDGWERRNIGKTPVVSSVITRIGCPCPEPLFFLCVLLPFMIGLVDEPLLSPSSCFSSHYFTKRLVMSWMVEIWVLLDY
jgi:hypothetical protein